MHRPRTPIGLMKALAILAVPLAATVVLSAPALAEPFMQTDPAGYSQDFPDAPDQGTSDFGPNSFGPPDQDELDRNSVAQQRQTERGGSRRQGGGQGQGRSQEGKGFMDSANMTAEQREQIKAIMQQGKSQNAGVQNQIKAKRTALMNYMQTPDASEAKARAMMNELHNLQKQASEQRLKTYFQMRGKLTPEQRKNLKFMADGEGGPGSGGPGGGGPRGGMRGKGGEGQSGGFQPGQGRRFQQGGEGAGQRRFQGGGGRRFQSGGGGVRPEPSGAQ